MSALLFQKGAHYMKWPESLLLIRHDVSEYNRMKVVKKNDPLYQEFEHEYAIDFQSARTKELAKMVQERWVLKFSDAKTPLIDPSAPNAVATGKQLRELYNNELPHKIFVSPYLRTIQTLEGLKQGWPELKHVDCKEDERIREQDHGVLIAYNDWKVFTVFDPIQKTLRDLQGQYHFRYPQGESQHDVRDRAREITEKLIRDHAGERVMFVTHHLFILSMRANYEEWGEEKFLHVDRSDKPLNCGVTRYRGNPLKGENGKLELEYYNKVFY